VHWCSSRGVVTVRGRRADAHNPKTNRGPATAQAPSGTPLCVGEERGLGGAPGQKESMLSLGRSHARQRPQRYSNPVSKRKTGIPAGRCKRLRNPTRARATTVWRGSNVSATAQSFFAGEVGCWLCHAPDVMPATAVPAGCPATTHHGQAGGRMRRDHFQPRITHPRIESGGGKAPPHAAYVPGCRPATEPSPRRFTSAPLMSGSSGNTRGANDFPCRREAAWSRVDPRGWHATASESCSRIRIFKVLIREQDR
jgi:hypothetical protein